MLACTREIRTVVRQPCPVYLFSQTDATRGRESPWQRAKRVALEALGLDKKNTTFYFQLGLSTVIDDAGGEVSAGLMVTLGNSFDVGVIWADGDVEGDGVNFNWGVDGTLGAVGGDVFVVIGESHNTNFSIGPASVNLIRDESGRIIGFAGGPGANAFGLPGYSRTNRMRLTGHPQ